MVIDFGRASRPGLPCLRAAVGSYLFHWVIGISGSGLRDGDLDGRAFCGGIIGTSMKACRLPPKCSVVTPEKIFGGRSRGSSCRNGPQPVSSFLKFESLPPLGPG